MSDCPNEHTINREKLYDPEADEFWITCGDTEIARARFSIHSDQRDVDHWRIQTMDRHLIDTLRARMTALEALVEAAESTPQADLEDFDIDYVALERDLQQLEREDPEVAAASAAYDETVQKLLGNCRVLGCGQPSLRSDRWCATHRPTTKETPVDSGSTYPSICWCGEEMASLEAEDEHYKTCDGGDTSAPGADHLPFEPDGTDTHLPDFDPTVPRIARPVLTAPPAPEDTCDCREGNPPGGRGYGTRAAVTTLDYSPPVESP